MEWETIEYVEGEKDTFTTIDLLTNSIYYIEYPEYNSYNDFIFFLQKSYKKKGSLTRQIRVDFPRLECYIQNTRINTLKDCITKLQNISYKKELFMICTQTSLYPITFFFYQKYTQFDKKIHLSDTKENNKIQIYIDLHNSTIHIYKIFRIIQFDEYENEKELETIKTCTSLYKNTNKVVFTYTNII